MYYTVLALGAIAFASLKFRKALVKSKHLKQGRDGEKVVGQYLDRLGNEGAHVFHDIPGEGFNLDHVVIHTTGIYVIETKTISKPDKGRPELVFDGEKITKNGHEFDRDPVIQVRAARNWLSELIKESTGRAFPVRSVVLYPGWFIRGTGKGNTGDVWVLEPKAFPKFVANESVKMPSEDVRLCAFHLSRYIRTAEV